jgi:hypothetical protein
LINSNKNNEILPSSPEDIKINQTLNGLIINWKHPDDTNTNSVPIEYYQIYFRQYIADDDDAAPKHVEPLNKYQINYEWRTTEPIQANKNKHFISETRFNELSTYEFQMVSFSKNSKSRPSPTLRYKYLPKFARKFSSYYNNKIRSKFLYLFFIKKKDFLKKSSSHSNSLTYDESSSKTKNSNFNLNTFLPQIKLSQLDFILVTIFLILILILIVCIVACVIYKRTVNKIKKKRDSKHNKGKHL